MPVTIRQIAEQAGVSRGTVDRVLNGRPGVKPDLREKILAIAEQLNYVPNAAAKALAYQKKPLLLGVVLPPEDIRFFDEIRKGITIAAEELKDFGIRLEYRHVNNRRPEEGAEAVEQLAEAGAAGILFSVMDDPLIRKSIDFASEQGVPVVTFNSDVEQCSRICFVGQDLVRSGEIAAGLMSRIAVPGSKILIVTGSLKFHAHQARVTGFRNWQGSDSACLDIHGVLETYDRYENTFGQIRQALSRHAEIGGIYMSAGHVGACIDALIATERAGRVKVVCNDLLPEVRQGMMNGLIDFTIFQDPAQQGYRALRLLYDRIIYGKKPENDHFFTETKIFIKESLPHL